jgi:hypothetical protein
MFTLAVRNNLQEDVRERGKSAADVVWQKIE